MIFLLTRAHTRKPIQEGGKEGVREEEKRERERRRRRKKRETVEREYEIVERERD